MKYCWLLLGFSFSIIYGSFKIDVPQIFNTFPVECQLLVHQFLHTRSDKSVIYDKKDRTIKSLFHNNALRDKQFLSLLHKDLSEYYERLYGWSIIASHYDCVAVPHDEQGYVYIHRRDIKNPCLNKTPLKFNKVSDHMIKLQRKLAVFNNQQSFNYLKDISTTYKIHLMPQEHEFNKVIWKILHTIYETQNEIQDYIKTFKFLQKKNSNYYWRGFISCEEDRYRWHWSPYEIAPQIVIYINSGMESAEKFLQLLVPLLAEFKGNGEVPRSSIVVNDLISYRAGDYIMTIGKSRDYFDPAHEYAIFKPDFVPYEVNNYKLKLSKGHEISTNDVFY